MQGTPEAFHAQAVPFIESHLRAKYVHDSGVEAAAGETALPGAQQKPITLRGSGNVQTEVPASAMEQFVTAFKRRAPRPWICLLNQCSCHRCTPFHDAVLLMLVQGSGVCCTRSCMKCESLEYARQSSIIAQSEL